MNEPDDLHLRRLLVAVDGSPSADLALRAAITAARRDHGTLTLVAVAVDAAAQAARWPQAMAYAATQEEADRFAQSALTAALAQVPEDVSVTTVLRRGPAAREILAVADGRDFDAILLGARGVGRVGSLMGSVSREILHRAEIPVFVAHVPPARD